uniref:uncharacterized protein LOC122597160 n=1 Tax=Erigeron canadensis TaxID=72917 RepID=UPI001CB99172|nr:uncharacterized protein LOC122597160 [Erigeron canadensis]
MARELRLLYSIPLIICLTQVRALGIPREQLVPCYYIFGDSLVDCGNNNDLDTLAKANYLPYGVDFPDGVNGRFTNGRTIADIIGQLLGFQKFIEPYTTATDDDIGIGVNYGSGSAGIREESGSHLGDRVSLGRQLLNHEAIVSRLSLKQDNKTFTEEYLSKCLYIVNIGNNDYINNYLMPTNYPSSHQYTVDQFATVLMRQYTQQLKTLYRLGARKIAVFGLGMIGCAPAEIERFGTNGKPCVEWINDAVMVFNQQLKPLVDELNNGYPDARFTFINLTNILAPKGGVALPNKPCCPVREDGQCIPESIPCPNRALSVYLDSFHPTEIANRVLAKRSFNSLSPVDASPYDISQLNMASYNFTMVFRILVIVATLIQFQTLVVVAGEPQVPCYFIFGDSLVDSGNNNGLTTAAKANYPPYGIDFPQGTTGRFTNGRTKADVIGQLLGFVDNFIPPYATATNPEISKGVNYGSGGAGIRDDTGRNLGDRISLNRQLLNHASIISRLSLLQRNKTFTNEYLKKCIYVLEMGSNDYINNYLMPNNYVTSRIYTPDQYAAVLVRQYSKQLMNLYNLGARKIAVFGLSLIGCTPAEIARFGTEGKPCVQPINDAVELFNNRLKPVIDEINTNFQDARFTFINMTGISTPEGGLVSPDPPCCQVRSDGQCIPNSIPCPNRDVTIFYDGFHPTEIVNSFFAARSYVAQSPMDASPYDIRQLARL